MSMKQAAEELLKIADEIEKEAAEVTTFVCDKCNHTASLTTINQRRKEAATTVGENVSVNEITVNDKISCPACDGVMAYSETETSAPYYFDPDKKVEAKDPDAPHDESKETPAEEAAESAETQKKEKEEGTEEHPAPAKKEALDYDSLERYLQQ